MSSTKYEKAMARHYLQANIRNGWRNGWRPPIKNDVWMLHDDGSYSAEASTLHANGNKDPWNRPFSLLNEKEHRDRDRDITHWTGNTTIAGAPVKLTVWND